MNCAEIHFMLFPLALLARLRPLRDGAAAISAISEIAAAPSRRGRRRASNASGKSMKWISAQFIHAGRGLDLLPPPLAGEGWGGGELAQIFACAPSLSLPRKRS